MNGIVHDAALDALTIMRDVVGGMQTKELGDTAVLTQYQRIKDNPQAIIRFASQRLPDATPDELATEAERYVSEMRQLSQQQRGGM